MDSCGRPTYQKLRCLILRATNISKSRKIIFLERSKVADNHLESVNVIVADDMTAVVFTRSLLLLQDRLLVQDRIRIYVFP